jgi:catechol 2,3-dioxygenase-like lactoylglutathione lyase family enzyme
MSAAGETSARARIHVSLDVSDVARSVQFYEAFFGVPAHKRRPGYANFDLQEPPLKLALQQGHGSAGKGALNHLGIQVVTRAQVDAARLRLMAAGVATFDEGDTVCCYARQDKLWATDPDGNRWEVYFLLDDMLDEDEEEHHSDESVAVEVAACCAAAPSCCG